MLRYVGWTGSRNITEAMRQYIDQTIAALPHVIVVTGGCIGVDAYVARVAHARGLHVHTIVPYDRSRVDPDWEQYALTCYPMPLGTTYKDRNQAIVNRSDIMYGVPSHPESDPKSRRSGTWQTIRMARRQDVPTYVFLG
jgi:predicted Rossmann-fold nucleotide-binding protein